MNKKAQISAEFIIILMLLMSVFVFAVFVYGEQNTGFINSRENFEAKLLSEKIARGINNVYLDGNGAKTVILADKRVNDFNAYISGNAVIVEWGNNYVDSSVLTSNVTVNSLTLGQFVNIKNNGTGIEIDNS